MKLASDNALSLDEYEEISLVDGKGDDLVVD